MAFDWVKEGAKTFKGAVAREESSNASVLSGDLHTRLGVNSPEDRGLLGESIKTAGEITEGFQDLPSNRQLDIAEFIARDARGAPKSKTFAALGAKRYNASTPEEQAAWERNAIKRVDALNQGEVSDKAKENVQRLEKTVDDLSGVFSAEKDSVGISDEALKDYMKAIYGAETNFGTHRTMVSSTGVVGPLQVTTNTFKDLVKQGILGDKAAAFLGFQSRRELQSLSNKEIRDLLKTEEGSFVAGTGKALQTLMVG